MEILREYIHDPQRTLVRSNPRKKTGNGEGCFCRPSSGGRRSPVSNPDIQSADASELSPEQRLEPPNTRLINAGIVTINDMETFRSVLPTRTPTRIGH